VLELKRGRGASAAALGVTALVCEAAAAATTARGCIMCAAWCKSPSSSSSQSGTRRGGIGAGSDVTLGRENCDAASDCCASDGSPA